MTCLRYRLIKLAKYTSQNRTIEHAVLQLNSEDSETKVIIPTLALSFPKPVLNFIQQHRLVARGKIVTSTPLQRVVFWAVTPPQA